jgi:hypothetical protein
MAIFECGHNLCEYCVSSTGSKITECVFKCNIRKVPKKVNENFNSHKYQIIKLNENESLENSILIDSMFDIKKNGENFNLQDMEFYNLSEDDEEIMDYSMCISQANK